MKLTPKPAPEPAPKPALKLALKLVLPALAALASVALAVSLQAQQAEAPPPAYRPGLGDLMTAAVQPRHVRIALAARQHNWAYAAFELHQLDEAFDRVTAQWPQWQRVRVAELVENMMRESIDDLGKAIETRNDKKFAVAYGVLTDSCNACHQAAKVGFVVIREPDASAFGDQDFGAKP